MPSKKKSPRTKLHDNSLRVTIVTFAALLLFVATSVFYAHKATTDFCANSESCITDLSGQKDTTNEGVFMGKAVTAPEVNDKPLYALQQTRAVLGETTADNKHIYVDLSKQRLYAYEGDKLIYDFPVSTGKWNKTPTGDFRIWIWLRYTRMSGGSKAAGTYYNLPNVPYTMYYWNDKTPKTWGYSLHGAYWHDNFGTPMSHGCVNMRIEDAGKIYYWTNPIARNLAYPTADKPGTLITVYGTTPTQ